MTNAERELPQGWTWSTIQDVTLPIRKVDPASESRDQFDYIDIASIDNEEQRIVEPKRYAGKDAPSRARQEVRAQDIVFSTVRTYLKNIAQVPEHLDGQIASTGFSVLRAGNAMLPKYLFYYSLTPSFLNALADLQRGTSYPAVRDGDVRAQPIPLAPLPEQHRIIAKIEELFSRLDAGVAALKRVQAALKRYKASVLKAACEGRLVPQDITEWQQTTLGEILDSIEAGKSFKCEERPPHHGEIGVVKVSAVTWGTYNELESKTCLDPERIEARFLIQTGDFLFSRANTIDLVGACVIAGTTTKTLMLSDKILRFRFASEVLPEWVLIWLRSSAGRGEIERLATGNQESMRNIGQDRIRQIRIALPSLAEQQAIVDEVEKRISIATSLEIALNSNSARASRLRQSILDQAFSGKLVPQDPADEPAVRLLEKIPAGRAETSEATAAMPGRRKARATA